MFTISKPREKRKHSHIMWRGTRITLCGRKLKLKNIKDFIRGNAEDCSCRTCINSLNRHINENKVV